MNVEFRSLGDLPGVEVIDHIERRRVQVRTPESVHPREADTERFLFPVDAACTFDATDLHFDRRDEIFVRDTDGNLITRVRSHEESDLAFGTYSIEISGPIKLYVLVTDSLTISAGADYIDIDFDNFPVISIGARSYHEQPATTLTVPDDPEAMMDALSVLSSALKTTRCERAYPTLRGHPPLIELGEELDIPDGLSSAGTGVDLIVPPEYESLFPVASLAFYLGADIVPGRPARITTDIGFEHTFADKGAYEDEVARVLKQIFFMDCLVRTAGFYQIDLYERAMVEDDIPFDIDSLYDEPMGRQVAHYLQVPFSVIEPALPRWCLTAHLPMTADSVEAIPFVVNELGVIRQPHGRRISDPGSLADTDLDLDERRVPSGRSDATGIRERIGDAAFVKPALTDESVEHAWFADHIPINATKATVQAYRNKLERATENKATIDIAVVCNDAWLARERETLDSVYGYRDELAYNIESHYLLDEEELREVVTGDCDFLHYIGDATAEGLACRDGHLDTTTLDDVGVDVFLLNANQTVTQALGLVENGAIGGVGTLGEVDQDAAIEIGRAMAHLLNLGFQLRSAVEIIREYAVEGRQYLVVGDGNVDIAQSSGVPILCGINKQAGDEYQLNIYVYPTKEFQIGSTFSTDIRSISESYLFPGKILETFTLSGSQIQEYLRLHSYPIVINGALRWNNSLDLVDL